MSGTLVSRSPILGEYMSSDDSTEMMGGDVWGAVADDDAGKSTLAIRILQGEKLLRTVRLEPDVTYIGRMPENHIVVDDPQASRSHARILAHAGQYVLEDQESENGVYFKGKRVKTHSLKVGDRVTIGTHTLEVVPAEKGVKEAIRESQLDEAEEQEWRMDQTVSVSSEELQRRHLAKLQAKAKPKEAAAGGFPKMELTFVAGGKTIRKEVTFERGKRRQGQGQPNQIEVRVSLGSWVLEKKIPLD